MAAPHPLERTTVPAHIPGQEALGIIPGGTLIAREGTPPLRVVLRLLADPKDRLWQRDRPGQTEQL
eukprot:2163394-Lingulodinium_polyedra.AAC.1